MELLTVIACQSQATKMTEEILHIGERGYNTKAADLENVFKDLLLCVYNNHN